MGKKKVEEGPKKTPLEIRAEVKDYIRNERDTILKKWMALEESIHAEDYRREQFVARKLKEDTTILPINIQKLIGSMKKAVHMKMKNHGGTAFSIIRSMFMYWDKDKSGLISKEELFSILNSLGLKITPAILNEIVQYYSKGAPEMRYQDLLADVNRGEPTIVEDVADRLNGDQAIRFEEVGDKYIEMPPKVKFFVEAVQNYISTRLRNEGGTPAHMLLVIFQKADLDHTTGLNPKELIYAAQYHMKLRMSVADAREVIDFYDRRGTGELHHRDLVKDVCSGVKSILEWKEYTDTEIESMKKRAAENPFNPVPFRAAPNKLLERVKREVRSSLEVKMRNIGGSVKGWVREKFTQVDPRNTGRITDPEVLRVALKSLGVMITAEEAQVVFGLYDERNTGEMAYAHLVADLETDDPHFITDATETIKMASTVTPTARAPPHIQKYFDKFKKVIDAFVRKSKGALQPRDVLHGTFLRFDELHSGRVDAHATLSVARELGVPLRESEVGALVTWFDTNGSNQLDYNEFTVQLCGDDGMTKTFSLPALSSSHGGSMKAASSFGSSSSSSLAKSLPATIGMPTKPFENLGGTAGATSEAKDKKLHFIETRAVKDARRQIRRSNMIRERVMIREKIESLDRQRRQIIEDHNSKRAEKK